MSEAAPRDKATLQEWLAVIGAIAGAFMATLDNGIASATLREVQGTLGARLDESSWITTSYLVAEIIAIPLTAYLANIFSPRRYLLLSCAAFIICSFACGMARSFPQMIAARFVQGLTGGTFIPMASFLVGTLLPARQRVFGFLIFSFATSLAPYIGAVIGGWISANYVWTYCYYMQVGPGLVLLILVYLFLREEPMKLHLLRDLDWWGIGTMAVGFGALTYVLREGTHLDWFNDADIRACAGVAAVFIILFVIIELMQKNPMIDLRLFLQRNFFFANVANALLRMAIYGNFFLLPLYLARVQNYNADQTGVVFLWFALMQIVMFPIIFYMVRTFDNRLIVGIGFILFMYTGYDNSLITHDSSADQFFWSQIIRAIGHPMALAPITAITFAGLSVSQMGSASALFNMMRQLAASLGSASLATIVATRYRFHYSRITETVTPTNPVVQSHLDRVAESLSAKGLDGEPAALLKLSKTIDREAFVMAYSDAFYFLALIMALAVVAILLTRPKKAHVVPAQEKKPTAPDQPQRAA